MRMVLNPSQLALQNYNMLCQFEKDQYLKLYQMWERKTAQFHVER